LETLQDRADSSRPASEKPSANDAAMPLLRTGAPTILFDDLAAVFSPDTSVLPIPAGEVRMVVYGVSWKDYVIAREALDGPGLRMAFCEGELELTSPLRPQEEWKRNISSLVEVWALERNVPLYGYGSTTFQNAARDRGGEPDECYCVGAEMSKWPQIVVEVVHTHPFAIDRRRLYAGLGAPEVWIFERGAFAIWHHDDAVYQPADRSALLPELNFAVLARFVTRIDQPQALKDWRERIRRV
jgi:Uma2 family endonuclease